MTLLLGFNMGFSQTQYEIDSLLTALTGTENSKGIRNTEQAEKIISYHEKALPILAEFFIDSTETNIKSDCHSRHLTKGELAIIMADHIDRMPYAILTGVRNCILEFCPNNSNLIEHYLPSINDDGFSNFKQKYLSWLSEEWIEQVKGKKRRERKKIINEWKESDNKQRL